MALRGIDTGIEDFHEGQIEMGMTTQALRGLVGLENSICASH